MRYGFPITRLIALGMRHDRAVRKTVDESIEAEAQAQAICMQTKDYERAYEAFVAKERPVFEGG